MSSKSRKYRKPNIAAATIAASAAGENQTTAAVKTAVKNNPNAIPVPTAQSFRRDLTWIGFTTLIIVILMVIAYYVVPR